MKLNAVVKLNELFKRFRVQANLNENIELSPIAVMNLPINSERPSAKFLKTASASRTSSGSTTLLTVAADKRVKILFYHLSLRGVAPAAAGDNNVNLQFNDSSGTPKLNPQINLPLAASAYDSQNENTFFSYDSCPVFEAGDTIVVGSTIASTNTTGFAIVTYEEEII